MSLVSSRGWKVSARMSNAVQRWLARRPAFRLVIQEVERRHARDIPRMLREGDVFETRFEREDLPGGVLRLTSAAVQKGVRSELTFGGHR